MAFSLESITHGKAAKAPRIVLLGVEKVGKSTLSAQADGAIFIPMKGEKGIDNIDCAKFPAAMTYSDVIEAIGVLYREEHDYKTAIFDSASALEPLIWDHACAVAGVDSVEKIGGGYGKWKLETLRYWREITDGLDALREDRNMSTVIIGHVKAKEFNDPEADPYTQYQFDITDNAAAMIYRWADVILFANFKKAIVAKTEKGFTKTSRAVGTGQRTLYTEKRPAHPGGNRFSLPYEMPMEWAGLTKAIEASQTAK